MILARNKSVVLFDGVCNLCNSSVLFILKHDKNQRFKFASLQSDVAKEFLLQNNFKKNENNSVILIENGIFYKNSTAILKIAKQLNGVISLFYVFIFIPKPIRDWFYTIIAKNRYKWFGMNKTCLLPNKDNQDRFL